MKTLPTSQITRLALAIGYCLLAIAPLRAATIPEPDTIFYGRVLSYDHGYDVLVTQGELVWKIQPNGDDTRTFELHATLEQITNGPTAFSYRLKVPHEALASGLALADLSPQTLALNTTADRYRHSEIRVNGESARILTPAPAAFDVAQARRATAYRLDLEVALAMPDTDGNGLPDWWQQRFFGHLGVDPNADADGDGLTNLQEYQAGTNPTLANTSPTIVWDNAELDEGATEVVALQAVDSDTPPTNLVYTLLQEPQGAHLTLLFGATAPGLNGKFGDKVLHNADTFTQAQVNSGRLAITHDNPATNQITFRLRLSDGDTNHVPYEATFTMQVHKLSPDDGTGASVWLSSRFASAGALTTWGDQSGAKPWLAGTNAPFDAHSEAAALVVTNRGPLGQPVLAFNLPGQAAQQSLALPRPADATVFGPGEITVFAVFNSTGNGDVAEQVISGPHFQLGLTGPSDHGRDEQVRFASEGAGVIYSNRKIRNQWSLVTAWQEQGTLAIELSGTEVGGPHPLDPPTTFGTDPAIGARNNAGQADQPFQGYLGEVLVFNRNLEDAERHRINYSLLSKWFGWVLLDGSDEPRNLNWRVPSSGLSAQEYQTNFIPKYGPDHNYILLGGAGQDVLQGGQNDDIIVGGQQSDVMTGGGGRDIFVFNFAHINHGADTITDFSPTVDQDALNVADLLRGSSRDLRDYLHLRTDGHNSYLDIDFTGARIYTNHTIVLQSTVLRDDDLPSLWAHGNLIAGDKRIPLAVSVATTTSVATEINATPAVFTVHFTGTTVPDGLEIPFELAGTAVRGTDYNLSLQRYNAGTGAYVWEPIAEHELFTKLKPGDFEFSVRVEPIPNNQSQPDRTVQFQLTGVPEWFDVTGTAAAAQIVDGSQRVSVAATDSSASEAGDSGAFTLSRAGGLNVPLDVTVSMTGPAENGVDYDYIPTVVHFNAGQSNVVVPVLPFADNVRELAEAVEMVLQPGPGYFVNPAAQAATVVIQDSGPVITVEAIEPLAVVQDGSPGAFLLHRQGMLNETLTVLLDIGGSATMNLDYRRVNRFVTFGPGATTMLLTIQPLAGAAISNGAETTDLRITPDASYTIGSTSNAQVRLVSTYLTFAQWKATKFPGDVTPLALFADQDFDLDGLPNGVEYAFGLDPKTPNTTKQGQPVLVTQNGHLGVRFTRPIAAVDVAYVIEVSSDLQTWIPANDDFDEQPGVLKANGIEEVTFLDQQPMTAFPLRFVRVRTVLQ